MRKSIIFAAALLALGCLTAHPAQAEEQVNLYVNYQPVIEEESLGQVYINEAGRTMVPLRVVNNYMYYTTDWSSDGTIHVTDATGKVDVVMTVGSLDYEKNGQTGTFDTAPLVKEGRTYLPARDFTELYGAIDWDQETRSVWIGDADTPLYRVEGNDLVRVTQEGSQVVSMPEGEEVSAEPLDDPSLVTAAAKDQDGQAYVAIQNHAKLTGLCDVYRDDGDHMTALGIQIYTGSSFAVQGDKVYSTMGSAPAQGDADANILIISTAQETKQVTLDIAVNACRLVMDGDQLVAISPDGSRHEIELNL